MQTQIVNFSIPKPLLQAIDYQAKREARTRSGLIQEAIRVYLGRKTAWEEIFQYGEKQVAKVKTTPKDLEKIIDDYRTGH